jgi:iron complex outermembrane recepter protein
MKRMAVVFWLVWAASAGAQPLAADEDAGVADYAASAVVTGPFVGVTVDDIASNVQQVEAADLDGIGLADSLAERLSSATINDVQNNPLQPDFQYRGFTASPLLGTPQGLAVYQNGVRINEPFGDVLQWDLIPTFALANVQLVPGTSPIYGLNALGGSLILRMKDGFSAPGLRVTGQGGSFSRYMTSAEYGHVWGDWALYAGGAVFGEQGWRDHSESAARNLFVDARYRTAKREVGVSGTFANTDLNGNGPAPVELLHDEPTGVFTWPDNTQNRLWLLGVDGRQNLGKRTVLFGNAYLRHDNRATLNGDAAEFENCEVDGDNVLCDEEGEPLRDESDMLIVTDQTYDAVFNTTQTTSDSRGASLQLDVRDPIFSLPNHFLAGASYDNSHTAFLQRVEIGRLTTDRTVQPGYLHLSGDEYRTDLEVFSHQIGVFVSDDLRVAGPLSLQLSARLNVFDTQLDDQQGDELDGHHTFARINPAIGLLYHVLDGLSLFASYGEANRAPSAAELSCADPDEPCRVPNAFVSDPPLEQVVSRSVEVGLRARLGPKTRPWLRGSIAGFGTRNQNDILFVAGSRVGTGYFQNAGDTQRVGLEASLDLRRGPLEFYAGYTLLHATFESDLELPGHEEDEEQQVEKGSRIPGLPMHSVKAGISVRPIEPLELGISMIGQSSQYYRGDEANERDPIDGFVRLDAHASYQVFEQLQLFARALNLLDTAYSTFGVLADPAEALPGTSDPRFLGRGTPFGIWMGVVVTEGS